MDGSSIILSSSWDTPLRIASNRPAGFLTRSTCVHSRYFRALCRSYICRALQSSRTLPHRSTCHSTQDAAKTQLPTKKSQPSARSATAFGDFASGNGGEDEQALERCHGCLSTRIATQRRGVLSSLGKKPILHIYRALHSLPPLEPVINALRRANGVVDLAINIFPCTDVVQPKPTVLKPHQPWGANVLAIPNWRAGPRLEHRPRLLPPSEAAVCRLGQPERVRPLCIDALVHHPELAFVVEHVACAYPLLVPAADAAALQHAAELLVRPERVAGPAQRRAYRPTRCCPLNVGGLQRVVRGDPRAVGLVYRLRHCAQPRGEERVPLARQAWLKQRRAALLPLSPIARDRCPRAHAHPRNGSASESVCLDGFFAPAQVQHQQRAAWKAVHVRHADMEVIPCIRVL
eukprot:6175085-Pleurochrysis_carterae.AAC.2